MLLSNFHASSRRQLFYGTAVLLGLLVAVWQFFTFVEVVQVHTAQAQKISQSAGWAGKAVGVMPQPEGDSSWMQVGHQATADTGMVLANWP